MIIYNDDLIIRGRNRAVPFDTANTLNRQRCRIEIEYDY